MPIIDMKTLEIHDIKHDVLGLIGSGSYTRAYELSSGDILCVTSADKSKEIAVEAQKFQNPHIPKIKKISSDLDGEVVYQMPKYTTFWSWRNASLRPTGMVLGTLVIKTYYEWYRESRGKYAKLPGAIQIQKFVTHLATKPDIPQSVSDAFEAYAVTALSLGHKDLYEDFGDKNLATTLDGETFILLDPFVA